MSEGSFTPGRGEPSAERSDLWERHYMDRRQRTVSAFVELERLISAADDSEVDSRLLSRVFARMPENDDRSRESIRDVAKTILNEYRSLMLAAKREEFELKNEALNLSLERSPENLGTILFVARTGRKPVGRVSLVRKEAYFIMTCAYPADYNLFYDPNVGNLAPDKFTKKFKTLNTHAGTHHASLKLIDRRRSAVKNIDTISSSVILSKAVPEDGGYDHLIRHERQHFINHKLLKLFEVAEGKHPKEKKSAETNAGRSMKDEIIAYVRDGSSGAETKAYLSGDAYEHLFAGMTEADRERFQRTIDLMAVVLDTRPLLKVQACRQALAFQLLDVPFEKIPHRIQMIGEYYQRKIDRLKSVDCPEDLIPDEATISSRFATERMRLKTSIASYMRMRGQYSDGIYASDPDALDVMIEELRVRRSVVDRDMGGLRVGGCAIPFGKMHFVDATRSPESPSSRMISFARDSFENILTSLTNLPVSDRVSFVQRAVYGTEPAFSDALTRGVGDSIVRTLLGRGWDRVEVSYQDGGMNANRAFVRLRIVADAPHLDPIHKAVFQITIHGKPVMPERVTNGKL